MAAKKNGFGLVGKSVTGNYRGAVMHGKVTSIAKQGTTRANTTFNVRETEHTNKKGGSLNVVRHRTGASLRVGK